MKKKVTANRVVLFLHGAFVVTTAAGLFVAEVNKNLPTKWQATAGIVVGILGSVAAGTVAVVKFLDGSQKYDALQAQGLAGQKPSGAKVAPVKPAAEPRKQG